MASQGIVDGLYQQQILGGENLQLVNTNGAPTITDATWLVSLQFEQLSFNADIFKQETFLELIQQNGNVIQAGYRDINTGQYFFVNVNGSDVVLSLSSKTSALISIEREELASLERLRVYEDGVLKHTFDDSNSPIVTISMNAFNSSNNDFTAKYGPIAIEAPKGTPVTTNFPEGSSLPDANKWVDESDAGVDAAIQYGGNLVQTVDNLNAISKLKSLSSDKVGIFHIEAQAIPTIPTENPLDNDVYSALNLTIGAKTYRMQYYIDTALQISFKLEDVGVGDIVSTVITSIPTSPFIISRDASDNLMFIWNNTIQHTIAANTDTVTEISLTTQGTSNDVYVTSWNYYRYMVNSNTVNIVDMLDLNKNIQICFPYKQADEYIELVSTLDTIDVSNKERILAKTHSEKFNGLAINTRRLAITLGGDGDFIQDGFGLQEWTGSNGTDSVDIDFIDIASANLDGDFDIIIKNEFIEVPTGTSNGTTLDFLISDGANNSKLTFLNVDSHATYGTFEGAKVFDNLLTPGNEATSLQFPLDEVYTTKIERRSGVIKWYYAKNTEDFQFVYEANDLTTGTITGLSVTTTLESSTDDLDIPLEHIDIYKSINGEMVLI